MKLSFPVTDIGLPIPRDVRQEFRDHFKSVAGTALIAHIDGDLYMLRRTKPEPRDVFLRPQRSKKQLVSFICFYVPHILSVREQRLIGEDYNCPPSSDGWPYGWAGSGFNLDLLFKDDEEVFSLPLAFPWASENASSIEDEPNGSSPKSRKEAERYAMRFVRPRPVGGT